MGTGVLSWAWCALSAAVGCTPTAPLYLHRMLGVNFTIAADGPGIEARCLRDFPFSSDQPRGPPNLLYNVYRVFFVGEAAGASC